MNMDQQDTRPPPALAGGSDERAEEPPAAGTARIAPSAAAAPENLLVWALKKEHEETCVSFRTAWDIYFKWYVAFITFNVLGFAFVASYAGIGKAAASGPGVGGMLSSSRLLVGGTFALQSAIAIYSTFHMWRFSKRSVTRLQDITHLMKETCGSGKPWPSFLTDGSALPVFPVRWGWIANSICAALFLVVWVLLML